MKKFAVTAGLFAAVAAGTFGTASADEGIIGADPASACAFYGLTAEQCQEVMTHPGLGASFQGQAWTGYTGVIR